MWKWRSVGLFVVGAMLMASGASATAAGPRLELHWDKLAGASRAVVRNSVDDVLGESVWPGALPRSYSADEEEAEIPILLLGLLRDQLENSSQPEADEATSFIRDLMDTYADTPVSELSSSLGVWVSYAAVSVGEWCGTTITPVGECNDPVGSGLQNALCSELACKRTTMRPLP